MPLFDFFESSLTGCHSNHPFRITCPVELKEIPPVVEKPVALLR